MNGDITYCSNRKCTKKKCERNQANVPFPYMDRWLADLEWTEYCIKKRRGKDEAD